MYGDSMSMCLFSLGICGGNRNGTCMQMVLHRHIKLDAGSASSMLTLRTGWVVRYYDTSGDYLELLRVLACYKFPVMTSLSTSVGMQATKIDLLIDCLEQSILGPGTRI